MDHFGIGQAVLGAVLIYMQSARRTGRTTSMLESLKDGDRVVFDNHHEADRISAMCKARKLKIDCVVVPVNQPEGVFGYSTSQGRTLFDHSWVERFYLEEIERCQRVIDNLQRQSSGYGEAHLETKHRAEQIAKWRI